jgi:hypothetical protein
LRHGIQASVTGKVGQDPDAYAERHDAHEREWEAQASKS